MSGIVGSRLNIRGSGLVGSLGTDGQIFTSSGAGAGAVFEDAAGGGAWNFISSTTTSSAATFAVTSGIDSTYDVYKILVSGTDFDTDDRLHLLQLYVGGSLVTGSDYRYATTAGTESAGGNSFGSTGTTSFALNYDSNDDDVSKPFSMEMTMYHPSDTDKWTLVNWFAANISHDSDLIKLSMGAGVLENTGAVTGFKLLNSGSGDYAGGVIRLYGISKS